MGRDKELQQEQGFISLHIHEKIKKIGAREKTQSLIKQKLERKHPWSGTD